MRASSPSDHLANWLAQKQQRRELGDRLEQHRELDHFFSFRRRSNAEAAAQALADADFRVSVEPGLLRTSLTASRDDALTDADVARVIHEFVGIAATHGGRYDGFGGTIVPVDEES
ncbi:ribonuclease E inhibitor RraB [Microbacterium sp. SORGH_AS_0862]|uniref:ribonuclease E inhibitor RraB n=1 Tax=Microbacterium sp. SORGH_AS_0862 TaxID=3041789 RepID=UPI003593859B